MSLAGCDQVGAVRSVEHEFEEATVPQRSVRTGSNRNERRARITAIANEAARHDGDRRGYGWTMVLRRQSAAASDGGAARGYLDAFELICCECGDDPDRAYPEVSSALQRIRGPYPIAAGIAAYEKHVQHHRQHATGSGERSAAWGSP